MDGVEGLAVGAEVAGDGDVGVAGGDEGGSVVCVSDGVGVGAGVVCVSDGVGVGWARAV
ncbi:MULTISPECIES: hypothetical protein [Streptomyces]|uniref:hypothetical protein n=1 Tax=Streptomyces TaxID=1883 RepID=UPI0033CE4BF3